MNGNIQIITGNGKGKTTSALGLAVKAVGAGKMVFIGQFLKSGKYSEINSLKKFSNQVTIEHYGLGKFVRGKPSKEDIQAGQTGFLKISQVLEQGRHDLVIIDEGNVAVKYGIIEEKSLLELFDKKPDHVHLIVTGRGATQAVINKADHVIEVKEIKHYYQKGVSARVGIEK